MVQGFLWFLKYPHLCVVALHRWWSSLTCCGGSKHQPARSILRIHSSVMRHRTKHWNFQIPLYSCRFRQDLRESYVLDLFEAYFETHFIKMLHVDLPNQSLLSSKRRRSHEHSGTGSTHINTGGVPQMWVPKNGWFTMENPIKWMI